MQQSKQQTSLIAVRGGQLPKAIPAIRAAGAQVEEVKTDHRGRHTVRVVGGDPDTMRNAPGVRNLD